MYLLTCIISIHVVVPVINTVGVID